jgi:hypothetical protein
VQAAGRHRPSWITVLTPRTSQPAAGHAIRGSAAPAPMANTTSTAVRARGWRPTQVDDDRPFAGQSRGSRGQDRKVQKRGSRDQGGPDRRRPQDVAAGGKLLVPALGDALRFGARGTVGNLPLGGWRTPVSQCEIFMILRMIASDRIDRSPFGSLFRQEVRPRRRGPSRRAWRWRLRSASHSIDLMGRQSPFF